MQDTFPASFPCALPQNTCLRDSPCNQPSYQASLALPKIPSAEGQRVAEDEDEYVVSRTRPGSYPTAPRVSPAYCSKIFPWASVSFSRHPPTAPLRTKRLRSSNASVRLPSRMDRSPAFLALSSFARICCKVLFSIARRMT